MLCDVCRARGLVSLLIRSAHDHSTDILSPSSSCLHLLHSSRLQSTSPSLLSRGREQHQLSVPGTGCFGQGLVHRQAGRQAGSRKSRSMGQHTHRGTLERRETRVLTSCA